MPIHRDDLKVFVIVYGTFATNYDKSSQFGVIVSLRCKVKATPNMLHYASLKSKRVCKSVQAAERLALMDGYDAGYPLAHTLSEMIEKEI